MRLIVIGSGPAGQTAAIQAAKLGHEVIVVEKYPDLGGACLNSGTIPSKSLREAIVDLTRFHEKSFYGKDINVHNISINDLNFRLAKILEEEREVLKRRFRKNKIEVVQGEVSFKDPKTLLVDGKPFEADKIVIAAGSEPRNPSHVPFDKNIILDSTRLLSMDKLPKSILILGAGIVGSEYASFFSALGIETTIIDKKDRLLPLLDREIGTHLQVALSDIGMEFKGNLVPKKIWQENERAHVTFEDGTTLHADKLLYALGRIANVDALNLDAIGIDASSGYIPVNEHFQTKHPHIYAVGDVIGAPALASTSFEQGRLASRHASGIPTSDLPLTFPIGIYTIPEISCIGATQEELDESKTSYEVGRAYYYEIARGHITGTEIGLFKILFDPDTLRVLGVHIIGRTATELIHVGQLAMSLNAPVDIFVNQVFNYPTFAEGYRIAALNGMNKIHRHL